MDIELFISPQYRQEREEIMQNLLDWALDTEDDPEPLLAHFIEEEKDLKKKIQKMPLSAGVDFPWPVKKATSRSGKYVILFTCLPPNAAVNSEIKQVNLDTIMPTAKDNFNELVEDLKKSDFD